MLYALLAILVAAPLAYGTTGPWAKLVVFGGVLLLGALFGLAALRGRVTRFILPGRSFLVPLICLPLLQLVPLPPELIRGLSPARARVFTEGIWQLQPDAWMPLSLNPRATLLECIQLAAALTVYLLVVNLLTERAVLLRAIRVLVLFGGLYALVAILYSFFPNGRILWLFDPFPAVAGQPFGTYVNGNHFAGLMALLAPLALAWFLVNRPQVLHGSFKDRVVDFFDDPRSSPHLLYGGLALVIAVSAFVSMSRGGMLSCLAGLLVFGVGLAVTTGDWRRGLGLALFVGILLSAVGIFGWDPIFADFQRLRGADGLIHEQRPDYWRDSLQLVHDYPIVGTGFGTFSDAYRMVQRIGTGDKLVDHAHNDYVELLTDGGLLGCLLVAGLIVAVAAPCWRAWRRRRSRTSRLLTLGVACGLVAMALHCLVEFNLHIGANLLWFAAFWGLLVACSHTRSRSGTELAELGRAPVVSTVALLSSAAVGILTLAGVCLGLVAFAPAEQVDLRQVHDPRQLDELLQASRQAARRDPLQADYHYAVGNIELARGQAQKALVGYRQALRLRPTDGELLQQTGLLLAGMGDNRRAGHLLALAVACDRMRPERSFAHAGWLLRHKRSVEALHTLRQALVLRPDATDRALTLLVVAGLSDRELAEALPERWQAWRAYGRYLEGRGEPELAESAWLRTARLAAGAADGAAGFDQAALFFARTGAYERALSVLEDGIAAFPGAARLYRRRGQYAERLGLVDLARESYRRTALLAPNDRWVRKRLRQLKK